MRMLVALIAVSVLALVGASPAMADENNCPGGSIIGGSHDDVKILGGTSCFISGATIGGNIQAEPGHGFIRIRGGTVGGDVQIKGGTGFSFCAFTTIGGNF